ncbi:GIY-YIG catalytic domain-containing protein [Tenacibaculum sp. MAR_2009_124]|uniref:GIY-YIG nuclease family protein n=1 Tax=Tenacibaculum sp. MAR_2009_124 TaxID=1250059 RepID=UPI00089AF83D|nr:GIY-YIG nuclease family protein [Tenacibaculum sp. MAR_2009_124]SEC65043.1 GIY-YIG catalytic domain-containing protein [Tenacibaculum sp. MAR_2009_124]
MEIFCVYMFLDKKGKPLYIGSSINLKIRIETNHFRSENGNLTRKCVEETVEILYHEATSVDDMKIKERYLINRLKPVYNIHMNNKSEFSFDIKIKWKEYDFDKEVILSNKRIKRNSKTINHIYDIDKVYDSWLPYGVKIGTRSHNYIVLNDKKNLSGIEVSMYYDTGDEYYIDKLFKNYSRFYIIMINNEVYISNHYFLGYSIAHYKDLCIKYKLDEKKDFLSVEAPVDNRLFKPHNDKPDEGKWDLRGVSFLRYNVCKKLEILNDNIIEFIDSTIQNIKFYKEESKRGY